MIRAILIFAIIALLVTISSTRVSSYAERREEKMRNEVLKKDSNRRD